MKTIDHAGTFEYQSAIIVADLVEHVKEEIGKVEVSPATRDMLLRLLNEPLLFPDAGLGMITKLEFRESTKRIGWFWNRRTVPVIYLVDSKLSHYDLKEEAWFEYTGPRRNLAVVYQPVEEMAKRYESMNRMWATVERGIYTLHQEHNDVY